MKRRELITLLACTLVAWPVATFAQRREKVLRIGYLSTASSRNASDFMAFEQGLRKLGYVEGQNWVLEFRNAEGHIDQLPELAMGLASLPVDVIVAPGPEATLRAASEATSIIPIVIIAVNYDPVAKGYIGSLARPGGNITGVFFMQLALSAKRISLLKEALPWLTRVFALYDQHSADQLPPTETASRTLGLELQSLELRDPPYDFDHAMAVAVQNQAQALVILSSPMFYRQRLQVIESMLKHRLPAIFLFHYYVKLGGLMAYGASFTEMGRQAAEYVDRIVKGAKPADLPVEQPTQFELVVNLKTAEALGLTLPPSILLQATEVIE